MTGLVRAALVLLALIGPLSAPLHARCEGVVPGLRPQNTAREFVGATLDEITERGFIEIAVYENFPPYSYEQGGQPRGVDIEVGRIIADALGVQARFRFVQPSETLEADLLNYVWRGGVVGGHVSNLMMRVPYNSDFTCRVEQVVFTGQYAGETVAVAYALSAYPDAVPGDTAAGRHEGAPVPAFFRYDAVGVENDSIADFYLTSTIGATGKMQRFKSVGAAMAALQAGQVMAVMGPLAELQQGAGDGIRVHTPPMPGFSVATWTLGLAVHHSHRDLGYAVDDAIAAALADGRIAAIWRAQGLDFTPPDR